MNRFKPGSTVGSIRMPAPGSTSLAFLRGFPVAGVANDGRRRGDVDQLDCISGSWHALVQHADCCFRDAILLRMVFRNVLLRDSMSVA